MPPLASRLESSRMRLSGTADSPRAARSSSSCLRIDASTRTRADSHAAHRAPSRGPGKADLSRPSRPSPHNCAGTRSLDTHGDPALRGAREHQHCIVSGAMAARIQHLDASASEKRIGTRNADANDDFAVMLVTKAAETMRRRTDVEVGVPHRPDSHVNPRPLRSRRLPNARLHATAAADKQCKHREGRSPSQQARPDLATCHRRKPTPLASDAQGVSRNTRACHRAFPLLADE